MAQGKCSLLKPVDNLTGTFFLFSQYAQDLTKQYSNPDSYRCLPSKFIAMDLDFQNIKSEEGNADFYAKRLGDIFQNYFENSCTFLRGKYRDNWSPEYTRTLLFQTLEKYNMVNIENTVDSDGDSIKDLGISKNIQYIGDIDIYSYNDNKDGIGYNEIYCYISNQDKCIDYKLGTTNIFDVYPYNGSIICGYEAPDNYTLYNGLSCIAQTDNNMYTIGKYSFNPYITTSKTNLIDTFVPCILEEKNIEDTYRTDESEKILDKFNINSIVVLYDIVSKNNDGSEEIKYKNIPLGIYFTGTLDNDCIMSNQITKYVNSEQIYNQGTSYGLRICNRFITNPFSTEIIESTVNGSSNISEIAPVLEKIGEILISSKETIKSNDDIFTLLNSHLSQFKNNKVNVPYIRALGKKKYWFVNGKNTGAVAEDETTDKDNLKEQILEQCTELFSDMLKNYYTKYEVYNKNEINDILGSSSDNPGEVYATKAYVDSCFEKLKADLQIYTQFD
jgi:uncharacterized protein (DUF4213/DUF364 family)